MSTPPEFRTVGGSCSPDYCRSTNSWMADSEMRQLRPWSLNAPSSWPLLAHVLTVPAERPTMYPASWSVSRRPVPGESPSASRRPRSHVTGRDTLPSSGIPSITAFSRSTRAIRRCLPPCRTKTTNRMQPKSAKTLGFRFSLNREQPPATVGFVTESVTGVSLPLRRCMVAQHPARASLAHPEPLTHMHHTSSVGARGSEVSLSRFLQDQLVHRQVRHRPLY